MNPSLVVPSKHSNKGDMLTCLVKKAAMREDSLGCAKGIERVNETEKPMDANGL